MRTRFMQKLPLLMMATGIGLAATDGIAASNDTAHSNIIMLNTLPVSPEALDSFLPVMQNNAQRSREESGNISFDVFQKESGSPTIFLFEQWKSKDALDTHMQTPHLNAVIDAAGTAMQKGLKEDSLKLQKLTSDDEPTDIETPLQTRNVLVKLQAKPEQLEALIAALMDVAKPSRGAEGNIRWDVYQGIENPNTLVIFERWQSIEDHERHQIQPYNQPVVSVMETALAEPISTENRFLLKDVSVQQL